VWVTGAVKGFWLGSRGFERLCVGGLGCRLVFGLVKGGLKTLCGWLGPWMGFWLGERGFEDSVWVAGAVDGLLVG
jgi:hypothetical protein